VSLLYIGSRRDLDAKLVYEAGIKFKPIFSGKLRRYFSWRHFVDPFLVVIGFFQSLWILIRFWPHAVFTKGGFVSLPVAFAAWILRRPIVLHESDSVMGLSNRIVSRLAKKVCVGFPGAIPNKKKMVFTGNPVRKSILDGDREIGMELTNFEYERPVLLIWGGSQGAQEVNELVEKSFDDLKSTFQVVHITGHGKKTDIEDESYCQFEYLGDELKHIYAITELVVGRAGANSLYELAFMRKPAILIPLRSAARDHQMHNAEYFENAGASIILRDQPLHMLLKAIWRNQQQMEFMKNSLAHISKPNAAEEIAKLILNL
jgi:UDP-N-acetylglucosamine--N-acetylmuramyl-(pentapeptide) pyrophosphoryl-undecaprenol N-acetylglucosamine transferase